MTIKPKQQKLLQDMLFEIDGTLEITAGHQITSASVMTDKLLDMRSIIVALLNMEETENA